MGLEAVLAPYPGWAPALAKACPLPGPHCPTPHRQPRGGPAVRLVHPMALRPRLLWQLFLWWPAPRTPMPGPARTNRCQVQDEPLGSFGERVTTLLLVQPATCGEATYRTPKPLPSGYLSLLVERQPHVRGAI